MEGLAWPVMPGVKPAASEPGRLACERMASKPRATGAANEKLSAGALWLLGRPRLALISSYPRAWDAFSAGSRKVTLRPCSSTCRPRPESV